MEPVYFLDIIKTNDMDDSFRWKAGYFHSILYQKKALSTQGVVCMGALPYIFNKFRPASLLDRQSTFQREQVPMVTHMLCL